MRPKVKLARIRTRSLRQILLGLGLALLTLAVGLPFLAGTSTYPIAVVDGNSMYPNLRNGDLIFFTGHSAPIINGSVIVFVQQRSGVPTLDALLQPVVIHRVIDVGQEPDGVTYYQTKGDNNQAPDPFVTDAPDVLGVPSVVIPFAGFPIMFAKSAYGMVSITAIVSLWFFAGIDTRLERDEEKRRLVAVFARHSLNGDISLAQFERLKLAVEYYDEMPIDHLKDPIILSTVDWLKGRGLEKDWSEEPRHCPQCGSPSFSITAGDKALFVCPNCSGRGPRKD